MYYHLILSLSLSIYRYELCILKTSTIRNSMVCWFAFSLLFSKQNVKMGKWYYAAASAAADATAATVLFNQNWQTDIEINYFDFVEFRMLNSNYVKSNIERYNICIAVQQSINFWNKLLNFNIDLFLCSLTYHTFDDLINFVQTHKQIAKKRTVNSTHWHWHKNVIENQKMLCFHRNATWIEEKTCVNTLKYSFV